MEAQPQDYTGGYERRRCYRNSADAKKRTYNITNMDKHEIDEALNEAYKRGWEDAFLLFKKNYNIVQGMDDAHEFMKPQNATAK
jgi:hypothetical protein